MRDQFAIKKNTRVILRYLFTAQHSVFENFTAVFVRQLQLVVSESVHEVGFNDVRLV